MKLAKEKKKTNQFLCITYCETNVDNRISTFIISYQENIDTDNYYQDLDTSIRKWKRLFVPGPGGRIIASCKKFVIYNIDSDVVNTAS